MAVRACSVPIFCLLGMCVLTLVLEYGADLMSQGEGALPAGPLLSVAVLADGPGLSPASVGRWGPSPARERFSTEWSQQATLIAYSQPLPCQITGCASLFF